MEPKRYVQHISGQGEKWELDGETSDQYETAEEWCIKGKTPNMRHFVPKSEYRLCDPPERWEDITEQVQTQYDRFNGPDAHWNVSLKMPGKNEGYWFRLRKVEIGVRGGEIDMDGALHSSVHAFIVERKVS